MHEAISESATSDTGGGSDSIYGLAILARQHAGSGP